MGPTYNWLLGPFCISITSSSEKYINRSSYNKVHLRTGVCVSHFERKHRVIREEVTKFVGSFREISGEILLMEEILHQLIGSLSHYLLIYRVSYIPGGCLGFLPSTVWSKSLIILLVSVKVGTGYIVKWVAIWNVCRDNIPYCWCLRNPKQPPGMYKTL